MSTLPYAHGGPQLSGQLKGAPEDFIVEEILGYGADPEGDHRLLIVSKRGANTDWVARELARFVGISPQDVGYAGMKDRHALTTQGFSVLLGKRSEPDWSTFPHAEVQVLSSQPLRRKIKRGALSGNRFTLRLRNISGAREPAEQQLATIAERGVPNYFGEQRFGSGGANVERATAMFSGKRVDRDTRSLLLSAARSQIFNAVLAERVRRNSWDQPMDGEVWSLAGSRSWFGPEAWTDTLAERLKTGDIHPSGPLWGRGPLPTQGELAELEQAVVEQHAILARGLESAGLDQDRRALRLLPQGLSWQWQDTDLQLSFSLPAGAYATVVIRELADTDAATTTAPRAEA